MFQFCQNKVNSQYGQEYSQFWKIAFFQFHQLTKNQYFMSIFSLALKWNKGKHDEKIKNNEWLARFSFSRIIAFW